MEAKKNEHTCNGQCKIIETMLISICETCGADDYPKPIKGEDTQINISYDNTY